MLTNPATARHGSLLARRPSAILECMKRAIQTIATVGLLVLFGPLATQADELKLKDGTKIAGSIVGFEDNSFKVKTSYGFALVQKDQVVSITVADTTKKPEAEKKSEPAAEKTPAPAKPAKSETVTASAPAQPRAPASKSTATATPAPVPTTTPASTPATAKNATPAVEATPTPPPKPAAPEPMREEVSGNIYMNETYGFRMYKPPEWQVIAGARTILPGAITAMGTLDETTYLLIGQESAGKSLASEVDATERRLRDIMDNFRPQGEKHITVSGIDALEHRFRGSVDQHDWSGIVVFIPRGTHLYTVFGMTYADTDLVQIQENIIARAISSLQFIKE
jgi:hypothetical protein